MRLVYLGTPEAAVPPLRALVAAGHEVMLVVSQPDRKRGRGAVLTASPVKAAAVELGLPVTAVVNDVFEAAFAGAELGVVVAFGKLIKPDLLSALPFVNLHFSLLPRWRGAAPVERAILAGDTETGVCLMALEAGLDTGPVYRRSVTPIDPDESASALRNRLVASGTTMLINALAEGLGEPQPQHGEPTHAAKLHPEEFIIDWNRSAVELHRLVLLGSAWTTFRQKRVKILSARAVQTMAGPPGSLDGLVVATGQGGLELLEVQPEGKPPQAAAAWRNGARPTHDERMGP